ncbi:hypothetical protein FRC07_009315, partial [Ceratobasidium sp. 392]
QPPTSRPTTRAMSRASSRASTQQEPQPPPPEGQSDPAILAMPGGMPPIDPPHIRNPVPIREISFENITHSSLGDTTCSSGATARPALSRLLPLGQEGSLDEIEDMTRVLHEQGGRLQLPQWPNPPAPTGSAPVQGTIAPHSPSGQNPVQAIAFALQRGLNAMKKDTMDEIQKTNLNVGHCLDLVKTQDQKFEEIMKVAEGARHNSYLNYERLGEINDHLNNMGKGFEDTAKSLSHLQGMAESMTKSAENVAQIGRVLKEQKGSLSRIEKTVGALDSKISRIEVELDQKISRMETEFGKQKEEEEADNERVVTLGSDRSNSLIGEPFGRRTFARESTVRPEKSKRPEPRKEPEPPSFMNQTTMAGVGIPKVARAKKPEPFSGKRGREAEGFLTRMNIYFGDYEEGTFNDNQRITSTLMNMADGDAAKWAQPLLQKIAARETHEFFRSWESFQAAFLRNFADPVKKEKAIRALENLMQTRSAQEYATQFCILVQEVDWNQNALIDRFKAGLKPSVQQELMRLSMIAGQENINTLEAWIALAAQANDLIFANQKLNPKGPLGGYQAPTGRNKSYQGSKQTASQTGTSNRQTNTVKIPDQEKERWRREKLCINCGKSGHVMKDCRGKWTYEGKPKVQGKAGVIEEEDEDKSESEN